MHGFWILIEATSTDGGREEQGIGRRLLDAIPSRVAANL